MQLKGVAELGRLRVGLECLKLKNHFSVVKPNTTSNPNLPTAAQHPTLVQPAARTPLALTTRTVYITSPARSAMQAGLHHDGTWRIDFDVRMRWENPLMGWTSSRDPMQAVYLCFTSKEDAIRFAERQGWQYRVRESSQSTWKNKSYGENFTYSPDPIKLIRTK